MDVMYEIIVLVTHVSTVMLIVWLLRERQQLKDALHRSEVARIQDQIELVASHDETLRMADAARHAHHQAAMKVIDVAVSQARSLAAELRAIR